MGAIHKQNAYIITNHLDSVLIAENNMDDTSNIAKRIVSKLSKFMKEFKTKEDVIGTFIKCTSEKQGALIIAFYEKLGVENKAKRIGNSVGSYYGTVDGKHIQVCYNNILPERSRRIRPRIVPRHISKPKFPRVMWVSNGGIIWTKAVVIAKINKFERKYIASIDKPDRIDAKYYGFKYAKEIKSNHN